MERIVQRRAARMRNGNRGGTDRGGNQTQRIEEAGKEGRETCLRLKEEEEDRGNKKRSGPSQGPEE